MVAALLDRTGFAHARQEALPADSSKRYARLLGGPSPALLMEAPDADYLAAFRRVQAHLARIGVPAPAVLGHEDRAAVVEDLGPTMAARLDAGADPVPLYADAARTLARLHAASPPPGLPEWDAPRMADAAGATLLDWWWPAALGAPPGDETRAALRAALLEMLAPFAGRGFVHRDFFPANLIPTPRGMAVIDFQDASVGPCLYDLVSLVEDARRDVDAAARDAAIHAYGAGFDAAAFAALAAQRHLRVAALWVRLARRDNKPHYLAHGPRCWALLGRALAHPACAPLARFLDAHVPAGRRGNPA